MGVPDSEKEEEEEEGARLEGGREVRGGNSRTRGRLE